MFHLSPNGGSVSCMKQTVRWWWSSSSLSSNNTTIANISSWKPSIRMLSFTYSRAIQWRNCAMHTTTATTLSSSSPSSSSMSASMVSIDDEETLLKKKYQIKETQSKNTAADGNKSRIKKSQSSILSKKTKRRADIFRFREAKDLSLCVDEILSQMSDSDALNKWLHGISLMFYYSLEPDAMPLIKKLCMATKLPNTSPSLSKMSIENTDLIFELMLLSVNLTDRYAYIEGPNDEMNLLKPMEWFINTFLYKEAEWSSDISFVSDAAKKYYLEQCFLLVVEFLAKLRAIREPEVSSSSSAQLVNITNSKGIAKLRFQVDNPKDFTPRTLVSISSARSGAPRRWIARITTVSPKNNTITVRVAPSGLQEEVDAHWLKDALIEGIGPLGVVIDYQFQALKELVLRNSDELAPVRVLFLEKQWPITKRIISDENFNVNAMRIDENLNESQKQAVRASVENVLTLIQGPPGTGKTEVAAAIVEQFLRVYRYAKILVCGFTNAATDLLAKKIEERGIPCLRMTKDGEVSKQDNFTLWEYKFTYAKVIAGTCYSTGNLAFAKQTFDLVLIDECTQCTELALLPPLIRLAKNGSIVLIGDHKQLPPIILSHYCKAHNMHISLFEHLVNHGHRIQTLDTQYRMHAALSEFPSIEFYNGALTTAKNLHREIPKGFPWPVQDYPLCFVHVEGAMETQNEWKSILNQKEAEVIVQITGDLLEKNLISWEKENDTKKIGITVITPYLAQKNLIETRLHRTHRSYKQFFRVSTVDQFQGSESEIIILNTVRSNKRASIGFLKDEKRINVMLTRARSGLIIVGNLKTLTKESLWKRWVEHVVIKKNAMLSSNQWIKN